MANVRGGRVPTAGRHQVPSGRMSPFLGRADNASLAPQRASSTVTRSHFSLPGETKEPRGLDELSQQRQSPSTTGSKITYPRSDSNFRSLPVAYYSSVLLQQRRVRNQLISRLHFMQAGTEHSEDDPKREGSKSSLTLLHWCFPEIVTSRSKNVQAVG